MTVGGLCLFERACVKLCELVDLCGHRLTLLVAKTKVPVWSR